MSDPLVPTLATRLDALHADVGEIKIVLRDLTTAITKLALIEERQSVVTASVDRAFAAISKCETEHREAGRRLNEIERMMPQHSQTSRWVYDGLKWAAILVAAVLARQAGLL